MCRNQHMTGAAMVIDPRGIARLLWNHSPESHYIRDNVSCQHFYGFSNREIWRTRAGAGPRWRSGQVPWHLNRFNIRGSCEHRARSLAGDDGSGTRPRQEPHAGSPSPPRSQLCIDTVHSILYNRGGDEASGARTAIWNAPCVLGCSRRQRARTTPGRRRETGH